MKQYTYEERKLILDFLKEEKKTLPNDWDWGKCKVIIDLINKFKKVKFGDIKNEIGTKFKRKGKLEELVIVYNDNNDSIVIVNIGKGLLFASTAFSDDIEVEIL